VNRVPLAPSTSAVPARLGRWLLALGVVALLLGDVWRVPHLLLSRHVVCGEHGELVHDHDGAAAPAPHGASSGAARAEPGTPRAHAHEHCSVLATGARGTAVVSLPQAEPAREAAAAEVNLSFAAFASASPLSVLSYAPKTSPPA
jgi:hypothetical protein